jgi:hypothetical protein
MQTAFSPFSLKIYENFFIIKCTIVPFGEIIAQGTQNAP